MKSMVFRRYKRFPSAALMFAFLMILLCSQIAFAEGQPEAAKTPALPKIESASAQGSEGNLTLTWQPLLEVTEEGAKPVGYFVYKKEWPTNSDDPSQVKTFKMGEVPQPERGLPSFVDEHIKPGMTLEYHIYGYNNEKMLGHDYTLGAFDADFPQKAMDGFSLKTGDGKASLSWSPLFTYETNEAGEKVVPEGALGVNIYRADGKEGPYAPNPINDKPIYGNAYVDETMQPGLVSRYKARPVRLLLDGKIALYGAFSQEVEAKIVDKTPPAKAEILWIKALDDGEGVRLRWTKDEDPGLLGYIVVRRGATEKQTRNRNVSGFITVDEFTDRKLDAAGEYVYRVVARDKAGNVAYSDEAKVTFTGEAKKQEAPKPAETTGDEKTSEEVKEKADEAIEEAAGETKADDGGLPTAGEKAE